MKTNVLYGDFSVAEYDDVSGKLGGLEATTSGILRSVNVIESAVKTLTEKSILGEASNLAIHARIDFERKEREEILKDMETMKPKIEWLEKIVGRALWVGTGIVSIITIALNYIPQILGKIFP
jgi:hypothetical protein